MDDGIISLPVNNTIPVPSIAEDGIVSLPIASENGANNVVSLSIMEGQNVIETDDCLDSSFEEDGQKYETEVKGFNLTPGKLEMFKVYKSMTANHIKFVLVCIV